MSVKLKILAIPSSAYIFGAEKMTLEVLGGLKDKGHSVFCMTNGWNDGSFHQELDKLDIPYTAVKLGWLYVTRPLWTLDSLWHLPKALVKAWGIIKKKDFDIIYTTSYRLLFLLYPMLRNKNIVYHVHDSNSAFRQNRFFIKKVDSLVTCYIAVSEFIRRDLMKIGIPAGKIKVVHNGIRINPADLLLEKEKREFINFGIVGQIIQRKGQHLAIDAVGILKKLGYPVNLIIRGAGDNGYKDQLQKQVSQAGLEESVHFKDPVKGISQIYKDIDVLISASEIEAFGLTILEANAYSIPCIAPNHSGFLETITEGENGFFFQHGQSKDLAAKMKFFLENPKELMRMGTEGRKIVTGKFTLQHMQEKVEKIFLGLKK